jgi:hypothetical protein
MADDATNPKSSRVLLMPKHHIRSRDGREARAKIGILGLRNGRMHSADDVVAGWRNGGEFRVAWRVAGDAFILARPFAVAVETLAVVGALEAWLLKVRFLRR